MDKLILTVAAVFSFGLSIHTASAQDAVVPSGLSSYVIAATSQIQYVSRSIYINRDETAFFVDAENLNYNLNGIVLRNSKGEEIRRIDVQNAPVDAIHQVSMEALEAGRYEVELSSATGKETYSFSW